MYEVPNMKRISAPVRCVFINIIPTQQRRFDLPMEFNLYLDGQPVRKFYRLYGGIASQRIELTDLAHSITIKDKHGAVLQQIAIPAAPYNYLCNIAEEQSFAITAFGPMRPTADCPAYDKLARLLTRKLINLLDVNCPYCILHDALKNRDLDYLRFEFWENALVIHFMPKSGHIPDLRHDFDHTESFAPVLNKERLSLSQTLALEAHIFTALQNSPAAQAVDFYYNNDGFLCAKLK